jgi:GT2 family glycosyltransferase
MPGVYIVILNYKRWEDTRDCLTTILRSDYPDYKVIVVDNDSQDSSLQHLQNWAENTLSFSENLSLNSTKKKYAYFDHNELNDTINPGSFPLLTFIQNETNSGFASGNNVALKLILKENAHVWLLNPDMVVQENTLSELVGFAGIKPFKSIIGSVIKSYLHPEKVILYGGAKINFDSATVKLIQHTGDIPEIDFICGGSLFTHTAHLNEIGLLPEDYFLFWEETDWCYQAKKKGYKMAVCMTAICYDKISTSIGKGFFADYHYTLNGLSFIRKYKKNKVPVALFFAYLRYLKRILLRRRNKARGVLKGIQVFLKRKKYADK